MPKERGIEALTLGHVYKRRQLSCFLSVEKARATEREHRQKLLNCSCRLHAAYSPSIRLKIKIYEQHGDVIVTISSNNLLFHVSPFDLCPADLILFWTFSNFN